MSIVFDTREIYQKISPLPVRGVRSCSLVQAELGRTILNSLESGRGNDESVTHVVSNAENLSPVLVVLVQSYPCGQSVDARDHGHHTVEEHVLQRPQHLNRPRLRILHVHHEASVAHFEHDPVSLRVELERAILVPVILDCALDAGDDDILLHLALTLLGAKCTIPSVLLSYRSYCFCHSKEYYMRDLRTTGHIAERASWSSRGWLGRLLRPSAESTGGMTPKLFRGGRPRGNMSLSSIFLRFKKIFIIIFSGTKKFLLLKIWKCQKFYISLYR